LEYWDYIISKNKAGNMFENVLIPISSEFYSKEVLQRGAFLSEKYKSVINLIYIIEEKTLNQTDKLSNSYRTNYDIAETKNEIVRKQKQAANNIVFEDAKYFFQNKNISFQDKIVEGEFSSIVKNEIDKYNYDLILMGFEKGCMLNYRLLDDINIPVWIEAENKGKSILAVCSNLAPNKIVPEISLNLSDTLGWNLDMLYVVDMEDSVQVDENCKRSDKKSERDLIFKGQSFVSEMEKKGVNIDLIKGSLQKETTKAANRIDPNLVVLGRGQKKKGVLGLPVKNMKRKMAEKSKYSILFIN
jgi:hypothetical protein